MRMTKTLKKKMLEKTPSLWWSSTHGQQGLLPLLLSGKTQSCRHATLDAGHLRQWFQQFLISVCWGLTNNQYQHGQQTELNSNHSLEYFSSSKIRPSKFLWPKALQPFPCLNPALLVWHAMTIRLFPPNPWRRQVWLNSTVDKIIIC